VMVTRGPGKVHLLSSLGIEMGGFAPTQETVKASAGTS